MLIPVKDTIIPYKLLSSSIDKEIVENTSDAIFQKVAKRFNKSFLNVNGGVIFQRTPVEHVSFFILQKLRSLK